MRDLILVAAVARVEQAVCAGEGDVAAAGTAEQGQHGAYHGAGTFRREAANHRFADRRLRGNCDKEHDEDDDAAENLCDLIDGCLAALREEDADCECAAEEGAHLLVEAEHRVKAERDTADIADVKGETAENHEEGQKYAETREHRICDFLPALARDADHGPDIGLRDRIHDDDAENHKGKRSEILCRELGGLG